MRRRGRANGPRHGPPGGVRGVAFLGPLPPTPTGIATYDLAVLDGLERIGFTREVPVHPIWPVEERHFATVPAYELGVYQLGNNEAFHLSTYRMVWQAPGLIVLHDLAMDDFVRALQSRNDPLGFLAIREALDARSVMTPGAAEGHEPLAIPWVAAVTRRARGIVVHSAFARRYLEAIGCHTPIFVVPHPVPETPQTLADAEPAGRALRASVAGAGGRLLVVAPGDVNGSKRLEVILAAVGSLPSDVHLAIVGRRVKTYDVAPVARAARLGERLHLALDVDDRDFLGWLHAADVIVELRHPHRGEVSGSLARAMQVGRASIVSGTGSYLDEPDGAVVHVAPGPGDPREVAAAIRQLAGAPDARRRIAAAARAHVARQRLDETTAHAYARAIRRTMAVVHDPVGPELARWAAALADIGMSPAMTPTGIGARYARALRSFEASNHRHMD